MIPLAPETVLYRLALAAALGLVIGYERETHGRQAGMKTNIIVGTASCLLMMLSLHVPYLYNLMGSESVIRADPSRIASYAVAGMGFLGAGAIIQGKSSIQGLTTAACLWTVNALGLAVGAGFIIPAVFAAGVVMLTLILLAALERHIARDTYLRIYMEFNSCAERADEISQLLSEFNIKVLYTGFDCRFEESRAKYEVAIRVKSSRSWAEVIHALRRLEDLTGLRWTEGYVP